MTIRHGSRASVFCRTILGAVLALASATACPQLTALPTQIGQEFVIDDFDTKITQADLGSNYFAGNTGSVTSDAAVLLEIGMSPRSNGTDGGSLLFNFDFSGASGTPFAGYFASLFGLSDTLVSFDRVTIESFAFADYFLDFQDLYGDSLAFPDVSADRLEFDACLETPGSISIRIELLDELGFDVFARRTVISACDTWGSVSLGIPADFNDSVAGAGSTAGFDWSRVSALSLIVEASGNPNSGTFVIDNLALVDTDGVYPDLDQATDPLTGALLPQYEEAFVEHIRRTSVLYFLDFASKDSLETGRLVQDRSTFADLLSVGGVGFQLSAYVVAAERGDLTRQDAAQRSLDILRFLSNSPQGAAAIGTAGYRGFFYHFLGPDGLRKQNFDFPETPADESLNTVELSTIDTTLAIAGVVTAGRYFNGSSDVEQEIRQLAEAIYARVDWPFMLEPTSSQFYLGWKPTEVRDDDGALGRFLLEDADGLGQYSSKDDDGVEVPATLDFYTDEAVLIALLAMGSPDPAHRLDRSVWDAIARCTGWDSALEECLVTDGDFVKTFPGALFTYQFGSVWLDTQALGMDNHATLPMDFFLNTLAAIDATRQFVLANPDDRATWRDDAGPFRWGISASDGPFDDYFAHGAPTAALATDGGRVSSAEHLEFQAEDGSGDGQLMSRGGSCTGTTVLLLDGQNRTIPIRVRAPASYEILVRYSNDNLNPPSTTETVAVQVDGVSAGSFVSQDTGDGGLGWDDCVPSEALGPVTLTAGAHELTLLVSGGDGFGIEVDLVTLDSTAPIIRPLADGTATVYGAGSAIAHAPDAAVEALWEAYLLGLLHPRFGFADAFNLNVGDALLPEVSALRETGFWANFNGFGIDHGPMLLLIDNHLGDQLVPNLFMSHPDLRVALLSLFPNWIPRLCTYGSHLDLTEGFIDTQEQFDACDSITAGSLFGVATTGDVTLRAGRSIALQGGFRVATGGSLKTVIDPALLVP